MAGLAGPGANGSPGMQPLHDPDDLRGISDFSTSQFGYGGTIGGTNVSKGGDGGIGGPVGTPETDRDGKPGSGPGAGAGGMGGNDDGFINADCSAHMLPNDGRNGADGLPGAHGAHGSGGAGGSVQNGQWVTASGNAGSDGEYGSGGGGAGGPSIGIATSSGSFTDAGNNAFFSTNVAPAVGGGPVSIPGADGVVANTQDF